MNQNDRPNRYINSIRWSQPYRDYKNTWEQPQKRQIIDAMMADLHTQQLDMIDAAVEASDMAAAKEVIEWIMKK